MIQLFGKSIPQREGLTSRRCKYFVISLIIHRGADLLATSLLGQGKARTAGSTARTRPSALVVLLASFCGMLRKHNC